LESQKEHIENTEKNIKELFIIENIQNLNI
jgi:hypothetical protein